MTCSHCGGPRDRPGQAYCRACWNDYMLAWRQSWSAEHRARSDCRRLAEDLKRRGILVPSPCEVCGSVELLEMHHDDYEHPERVRWRCRSCHRRKLEPTPEASTVVSLDEWRARNPAGAVR